MEIAACKCRMQQQTVPHPQRGRHWRDSAVGKGCCSPDRLAGLHPLCLPAAKRPLRPSLPPLWQFSGAKQLPGGEEGARQLAAATNIGEALGLQHCDLASLEKPGVQPGPAFPEEGEDGQVRSRG